MKKILLAFSVFIMLVGFAWVDVRLPIREEIAEELGAYPAPPTSTVILPYPAPVEFTPTPTVKPKSPKPEPTSQGELWFVAVIGWVYIQSPVQVLEIAPSEDVLPIMLPDNDVYYLIMYEGEPQWGMPMGD